MAIPNGTKMWGRMGRTGGIPSSGSISWSGTDESISRGTSPDSIRFGVDGATRAEIFADRITNSVPIALGTLFNDRKPIGFPLKNTTGSTATAGQSYVPATGEAANFGIANERMPLVVGIGGAYLSAAFFASYGQKVLAQYQGTAPAFDDVLVQGANQFQLQVDNSETDPQRIAGRALDVGSGGNVPLLAVPLPKLQSNRFDNFAINSSFDLAQRQAPATLTTYSNTTGRTFGADHWGMTNENTSIQYARVDTIAAAEAGLAARYYGQYKKITSTGKCVVSHVIEAKDVAGLRGRAVRFQAKLKRTTANAQTLRMAVLQLNSSGVADTMPATFVSAFGAGSTDPTWGTNLAALTPLFPELGTIVGNGLNCVLTTAWQKFSLSVVVPTNCVNLVLVFFNDAGIVANDTFNIAEVGLYDGRAFMDWQPRSYADEVRRCQRFYTKTFDLDTLPAASVGVNTGELKWTKTVAGATAARSPVWQFPVPMRVAPTTNTAFNPAAAGAQVRDETNAADCTATAFVAGGERSIAVTATGAAGTTAEALLGVHITCDAEI